MSVAGVRSMRGKFKIIQSIVRKLSQLSQPAVFLAKAE